MKRTFIAIMMLAGWMQTACAQHTIESIRKTYQENWEVINMMSDNFPSDGIPIKRTCAIIMANWKVTRM